MEVDFFEVSVVAGYLGWIPSTQQLTLPRRVDGRRYCTTGKLGNSGEELDNATAVAEGVVESGSEDESTAGQASHLDDHQYKKVINYIRMMQSKLLCS